MAVRASASAIVSSAFGTSAVTTSWPLASTVATTGIGVPSTRTAVPFTVSVNSWSASRMPS